LSVVVTALDIMRWRWVGGFGVEIPKVVSIVPAGPVAVHLQHRHFPTFTTTSPRHAVITAKSI